MLVEKHTNNFYETVLCRMARTLMNTMLLPSSFHGRGEVLSENSYSNGYINNKASASKRSCFGEIVEKMRGAQWLGALNPSSVMCLLVRLLMLETFCQLDTEP